MAYINGNEILFSANISGKPEQEKAVEITENGITEITADEGYTLSRVVANVNVVPSGENKLIQLVEGTVADVTEEHLKEITKIRDYCFYNCQTITSIIIPNNITYIGSCAFYESKSLLSVIIKPDGVINIGDAAFSNCGNLKDVTIGNGVQNIPKFMFYNNYYGLSSIVIPDSVTSIGSQAFSYCHKLKTVRIGNGITSISNQAFQICNILTDIYIDKPEGSISGSPWGATNAQIHWNTPLPTED